MFGGAHQARHLPHPTVQLVPSRETAGSPSPSLQSVDASPRNANRLATPTCDTPVQIVYTICLWVIEFDPNKNTVNKTKHGVSLALAAEFDDTALIAPAKTVAGEVRYRMLGMTSEGLLSAIRDRAWRHDTRHQPATRQPERRRMYEDTQ